MNKKQLQNKITNSTPTWCKKKGSKQPQPYNYKQFTKARIHNIPVKQLLRSQRHPNYIYDRLLDDYINGTKQINDISNHYFKIEGPCKFVEHCDDQELYLRIMLKHDNDNSKDIHLTIVNKFSERSLRQDLKPFQSHIHYTIEYNNGNKVYVYFDMLNKDSKSLHSHNCIIRKPYHSQLSTEGEAKLKHSAFTQYIKPLKEKIEVEINQIIEELDNVVNNINEYETKADFSNDLLSSGDELAILKGWVEIRIRFLEIYKKYIKEYERFFFQLFPEKIITYRVLITFYENLKEKIDKKIKHLNMLIQQSQSTENNSSSVKYSSSDNNHPTQEYCHNKKNNNEIKYDNDNELYLNQLFSEVSRQKYLMNEIIQQLMLDCRNHDLNSFENTIKIDNKITFLPLIYCDNFCILLFICTKEGKIDFLNILLDKIFAEQNQLNKNVIEAIHLLTTLLVKHINWKGIISLNDKVKQQFDQDGLDAILTEKTDTSLILLLLTQPNHHTKNISNKKLRDEKAIYIIKSCIFFLTQLAKNKVLFYINYREQKTIYIYDIKLSNRDNKYRYSDGNKYYTPRFYPATIVAFLAWIETNPLLQQCYLDLLIQCIKMGAKDNFQNITYKKNSRNSATSDTSVVGVIFIALKLIMKKILKENDLSIKKIEKLLDIILLVLINNSNDNDKANYKKYIKRVHLIIEENFNCFIQVNMNAEISKKQLIYINYILIQITAGIVDLINYLSTGYSATRRNIYYFERSMKNFLKKPSTIISWQLVYALIIFKNCFDPNYYSDKHSIFKSLNTENISYITTDSDIDHYCHQNQTKSFIETLLILNVISYSQIKEMAIPKLNKNCKLCIMPSEYLKMFTIGMYKYFIKKGIVNSSNFSTLNPHIQSLFIHLVDQLGVLRNNNHHNGIISSFYLLPMVDQWLIEDNVAVDSHQHNSLNLYVFYIVKSLCGINNHFSINKAVYHTIQDHLIGRYKNYVTLFKHNAVVKGNGNEKNTLVPLNSDINNNTYQPN